MTDTALLLAGPVFALLALLFFSVPCLRPGVLSRAIGWLAACMAFPMVIGIASHSSTLVTLAFLLKPVAAMGSVTLFIGYLLLRRDRRLPWIKLLPSTALICGSAADLVALHQLGNTWGGASC